MQPQITRSQWLGLPRETRTALVKLFEIPRSGFTEVVDGRVINDGYTQEDLAAITVGRLQELLDTEDFDLHVLFVELVNSIQTKESDRPIDRIEKEIIKEEEAALNEAENETSKSIHVNDSGKVVYAAKEDKPKRKRYARKEK